MYTLFKKFYKYIALFLLVLIGGSYFIEIIEDEKRDSYLQAQAKILQTKYDTNYKYFKIVSEDIRNMLMDIPAVVETFSHVKNSDAARQAELRKKLYDLLKKRYRRLKNMGVHQLHFHLPDNTSFLRMHRPEKFGDDLSDIRYSVSLTNRTKQFTEGFEMGRVIHGFRFVYPVYDRQKEYLGSMEISLSSKQLLNVISDSSILDAHFLILKKSAEGKAWLDEQKEHYGPGWENQDYLLETATHQKSGNNDLYKEMSHVQLTEKIAEGMKREGSFAVSVVFNTQNIVLTFVPIRNARDSETAAYLVTYAESDYLDNLKIEERYKLILFYVVLLLLFIFGIYAIVNEDRLYKMAHFDTLTALPNRASFHREFKLELGKALELKTRHKIISVSVGREDIADVVPVAPKSIRVLGLKSGSTNLIIRYDDNSAEEFEILVNKGFTVEVISGTVTDPNASLTGW